MTPASLPNFFAAHKAAQTADDFMRLPAAAPVPVKLDFSRLPAGGLFVPDLKFNDLFDKNDYSVVRKEAEMLSPMMAAVFKAGDAANIDWQKYAYEIRGLTINVIRTEQLAQWHIDTHAPAFLMGSINMGKPLPPASAWDRMFTAAAQTLRIALADFGSVATSPFGTITDRCPPDVNRSFFFACISEHLLMKDNPSAGHDDLMHALKRQVGDRKEQVYSAILDAADELQRRAVRAADGEAVAFTFATPHAIPVRYVLANSEIPKDRVEQRWRISLTMQPMR